MSTLDATVNANETISGGSVTHVGQMFFDQDLITLVETQEPYASNTQDFTDNSDDSILAEEADTVDPFIEYVLLGDDVSEGVFGWLAFGMDSSNAFNITPAAYLTENGGVANANSGGGMGGGPGGAPSGSPPSGAMPSGTGVPTGTIAASSAVGSTLSTAVVLSVSSSAAGEIAPGSTGVAPPSGARPSGAAPSNGPQGGDGRSHNSGNGQKPQSIGQGQPKDQRPQAQQHEQGPRA